MEIRILGKYKLLKKIGRGAFGVIYQALNIKSSEDLAIKMESVKASTP